ncbi:MAG: HNH endonuclease, partial [bacterium]
MKNKDLTKLMLSSGREHKCSECKIPPFYNQKPITLQVDHIDGVNTNNNMENLRFLCP